MLVIHLMSGDAAALVAECRIDWAAGGAGAMDPVGQRGFMARRLALRRLRAGLALPAIPLPAQGPPPLGCSASGSGCRFLVAVASSPIAVGVDLEIEERWPLAAEALGIADVRAAARCWVRLEAVVKAARCGLAEGMRPSEFISQCTASGPVLCAGAWWNVIDVAVPVGIAALAIPVDAQVHAMVWAPEQQVGVPLPNGAFSR